MTETNAVSVPLLLGFREGDVSQHRVPVRLDNGMAWTEVEAVVYGGDAIGARLGFPSSVASGTHGPFGTEPITWLPRRYMGFSRVNC